MVRTERVAGITEAGVSAETRGAFVVAALDAARLGLRAGVVGVCCWSIMHPPGRERGVRTVVKALPPGAAQAPPEGAHARPGAVAEDVAVEVDHGAAVGVAASVQRSARRGTADRRSVACFAIAAEVFASTWVSSPCVGARPPLWCE